MGAASGWRVAIVIAVALGLGACASTAECDCASGDTFVSVGSVVPARTAALRLCANGRCATASLDEQPGAEGGRQQMSVSAGRGHDTVVTLDFLDTSGKVVRRARAHGTRHGGGCCGPYLAFDWRPGRNELVESR